MCCILTVVTYQTEWQSLHTRTSWTPYISYCAYQLNLPTLSVPGTRTQLWFVKLVEICMVYVRSRPYDGASQSARSLYAIRRCQPEYRAVLCHTMVPSRVQDRSMPYDGANQSTGPLYAIRWCQPEYRAALYHTTVPTRVQGRSRPCDGANQNTYRGHT